MSTTDSAVGSAVQALWAEHRDGTLARLTVLERAVTALMAGELDEATRLDAERQAHMLAGSVGMFGFAKGTEIARELERTLEARDELDPSRAPVLAALVLELERELQSDAVEIRTVWGGPPDGEPLLLVVDDDDSLCRRLAAEAVARGLRAEIALTPAAARLAVQRRRPDAVLLDLNFPGGTADAFDLLGELTAGDSPVPVHVITASDAFTDRVEVARRGGRGFLHKSLAPAEAIDAITQSLQRLRAEDTTVLAVDDDPVVLDAIRTLLEPRGLRVSTLGDPSRFWEALESVKPDLLLLDVDMPQISGIELCRTVRSDARWSDVPVVFLTARRDPDTVHEVFAAGADDFLVKPIVEPELVVRIDNRLERLRLHKQLSCTDGLTGLLNRRSSSEALARLARLAKRYGEPLSLAVLDLDRFKRVNDRFGHAAGDSVLRRLGDVLRHSFRGEDVVGRWGGEEFAVGMYGMSRDDGVQRIAEVLEEFRQEEFADGGATFRATFSVGVAQLTEDADDVHSLYRAADEALYRAKASGRDRVVAAGAPADRDPHDVDVVCVEDDEALAGVLLHALTTRGYRTRWLTEGPAAVAALGGSNPQITPRVVVLDVGLPGLDGLAVLRRLAAEGALRRTRVIMLTARAGEAEVMQALELGAYDHVGKPFSVPVLMEKVRRAAAA